MHHYTKNMHQYTDKLLTKTWIRGSLKLLANALDSTLRDPHIKLL